MKPRLLALAAAIVAATVLAYSPVIASGGFIWDDDDYVTENEMLDGMDGLARLWTPRQTRQYYPLVFTTFWLEYQVWGLWPNGFHITNILLHACNALLIWKLFSVLGVRGAWMIGAVFALHPVHAESVAWITERKNVLSALFYLLAALAYLRFDRDRDWKWYGAALAAFVAALLSKTVTCSLPAALILAMLFMRLPMNARRLVPLVPFFAIGLVLALHTAHLERTNVGAVGAEFDYAVVDRLLIASRALLFYPSKLILPYPLIFIYPKWQIDPAVALQWLPVASGVLVIVAAAIAYARGRRGVPLAIAFYAGTIFPALGFINVYPMRYSFVADHFQYLASIGIIAAVVGVAAGQLRPRIAYVAAGIVLVTLGVLTLGAGGKYRGLRPLWETTLAQNPDCWMCHNNYGKLLLVEEQPKPALAHFQAAQRVYPGHFQSLSNAALALGALGRHDEAIEYWERVVLHDKNSANDGLQLGHAYQAAEMTDDAIAAWRRVVKKWPEHLSTHLALANLLATLDRWDEAIPHYQTVLEHNPADASVHATLGQHYEQSEQYDLAIKHYAASIENMPASPERGVFDFRLTRLLALCPQRDLRRPAAAVQMAEQLAQLTQNRDPLVLDTLAAGYAGVQRFEDAIRTAQRALELARQAGLDDLAAEIEDRLAAYESRSPDF
jgi:tetratricopeptide (TPR) repeat protein